MKEVLKLLVLKELKNNEKKEEIDDKNENKKMEKIKNLARYN